MADQNDQLTQILLGLGELKGHVQSIEMFLTTHVERMDRQDNRIAATETALSKSVEAINARTDAKIKDVYYDIKILDNKINQVERRMAYWLGGAAVVVFLIEIATKTMPLFGG